ncbi:hypothetical protein F5Y06DRAFT_254476 [Hypoxylon sp. FL0890]|nr:hypothetical protein F5Y06DRAFT_254476 [Hypoxylon sp. FL0890]
MPSSIRRHPLAVMAHEAWEKEQARREAEFLEWQSYMARTPGLPETPAAPKPEYVETEFCKSCRSAGAKILGVKGWIGEKKEALVTKYKEVAFKCERVYWLNLTTYRQSKWPHLLRMIWYLFLMMLALALVAYTAKLKMEQWAEEAAQPQNFAYELVPQYRSWSVSKPRCECHCPCDVSCPTTFG